MPWGEAAILPGTWVIFGVILVPVYTALVAWFLGSPRDVKTGLIGLTYFVGIILAMWVPMYILTIIIGIIFF